MLSRFMQKQAKGTPTCSAGECGVMFLMLQMYLTKNMIYVIFSIIN